MRLETHFMQLSEVPMATIVGLLALCFMSFKIGTDFSLVLAKGVLASMICIVTVLLTLLIIFDKGIKKTAKKELPLKMGDTGILTGLNTFVDEKQYQRELGIIILIVKKT